MVTTSPSPATSTSSPAKMNQRASAGASAEGASDGTNGLFTPGTVRARLRGRARATGPAVLCSAVRPAAATLAAVAARGRRGGAQPGLVDRLAERQGVGHAGHVGALV